MAAFDFDGTLIDGDSLVPFLARLGRGGSGARGRVAQRGAEGWLLARAGPAMLRAYCRSGRDAAKAVLLERTVTGLAADTAAAAGAAFGQELARRLRPDMAALLRWHRAADHHTVIVSASLDLYLEPFARATGFDRVLATSLEVGADGRLTGRIQGANVRGPEKASRLTALLASLPDTGGEPPELWVYGDSAGDDQMLAMADHARRVSRGLSRLRHVVGGLVEGRRRAAP